nr:immunoglobulin heavy chain junction region [Mus musculus]
CVKYNNYRGYLDVW